MTTDARPAKKDRLTRAQYATLASLRNHMGVSVQACNGTVESLRRRGLLKKYDFEITAKGNAIMDAYSARSLRV
jgi:hypothetical protein